MNIVMFADAFYPEITGVVVSIKSFSNMLANNGHKIMIVCPDYQKNTTFPVQGKSYVETSDVEGVTILRVLAHKLWFAPATRDAKKNQLRSIKKIIDDFKPDVAHIHTEFVIGRYGYMYAKKSGVPLCYTFHTMWEDYLPNYIRFLPRPTSKYIGRSLIKSYLKKADQVICPTPRIAQIARDYQFEGGIKIIPTGMPPSLKKIAENEQEEFKNRLTEQYPQLKDKKILLFVGRIAFEKNIPFLFDVMDRLKKDCPDTVLVIVGKGPWLDTLKSEAQEHESKDKIFFMGEKSQQDLAGFYSTSDVFVFPSLTETQGLVTIEAMSCGLPVVAIGVLGTEDVMQGDNGGFMVKNDLEDFIAKCKLLLEDSDLREQKSLEAKLWSQKWSLENLWPQMLDAYRCAIENFKKEK